MAIAGAPCGLWGRDGMWARGYTRLSRAHGRAELWELELSPATASVGKGLMGPGAWHGLDRDISAP